MDHFYDNSLQTGLMRDIAIDIEILGEHIVMLGNQAGQIGLTRQRLFPYLVRFLGCRKE